MRLKLQKNITFVLLFFLGAATALAADSAGDREALLDQLLDEGVLPGEALKKMFAFFEENLEEFDNQKYMTLVDYSRPNKEERFHVIDLESGEVESLLVAHGAGRDGRSNPRDIPRYFSNEPGARVAALGFYRTGSDYPSDNFGRGLNLHGMEEHNDNAYERRIVVHGADYVNAAEGVVGRSWGCPALDYAVADRIMDRLQDGSLFYITGTPVED